MALLSGLGSRKFACMQDVATQRMRSIRTTIRQEERRLLDARPWLARQDLLGFVSFAGSLLVMTGIAALYLQGLLPWWATIPLMALPLSILHELEHDLIHDLYFRKSPVVQHLMFLVIWISKLSINPWYRREIHLRHHQESGQKTDIEERLIGLGLPWGPLRMIVAIHPMAGLLLFNRIKKDVPDFQPLRLSILSGPTYLTFLAIWEAFFGYARVRSGWTFAWDPAHFLPAEGWPIARDLAVLFVLPNILRQTSLVLMSSYSHYYEDIPERDVFYQNQILNCWSVLPFQLFCFNFGATHIIHHYVVNQPFYMRQLVSRAALAEMARQGTRVNDFATVTRNNRWGDEPAEGSTSPTAEVDARDYAA